MSKKDIEDTLKIIRNSIEADKCEFFDTRIKNRNFLLDWCILTEECLNVIKELTIENFSYVDFDLDKKHRDETVYIFGKTLYLRKRFSQENDEPQNVDLYIKIKVKEEDSTLVISFHEAERKLIFPYHKN